MTTQNLASTNFIDSYSIPLQRFGNLDKPGTKLILKTLDDYEFKIIIINGIQLQLSVTNLKDNLSTNYNYDSQYISEDFEDLNDTLETIFHFVDNFIKWDESKQGFVTHNIDTI